MKVRFNWAARPDPFSEYRAGFDVRTLRRCERIDVITSPGDEVLYRSYEFRYLDELEPDAARISPNACSLLSEIGVVGQDGDRHESLPPLHLSYTPFDTALRCGSVLRTRMMVVPPSRMPS